MKNSRRYRSLFLLIFLIILASVPASAKDQWTEVRSKNFFLIGNASPDDIKKVANRLEQFRESFRLLFTKIDLTSPIPTNVVVFKSDSSYKQFKPKRADGKIDNFVAGYFQPGEDVNYITLSTDGEDQQTFSVIFHEYVHSIVETNFGKSEVPPWINEGLAEYYSTFVIESDQKLKLGLPLTRHLELLQQSKFIPLDQLFNVGSSQLLNTGDHSRSIFYAESWALVHYLLQGNKGANASLLGKFLDQLLRGVKPETAFQQVFGMTYQAMESELRKYVKQSQYTYQTFTLKNKMEFGTEMSVRLLDEASVNGYLGDLLSHTQRDDDAEPFLLNALKLDPTNNMATTTLGIVKMKQRKFDEARKYLEIAASSEQRNYKALYNYAYLLSREGRDDFGYVRSFSPETAAKMRAALEQAIKLNPTFTPSYELFAFLSVVTNDGLAEAAAAMQKAVNLQPGNEGYILRLAEIYMKLDKFAEATAVIERISRTTDDPQLKQRAEQMALYIKQRQEFEAAQKQYQNTGGQPRMIRRTTDKPLTEAELAKVQAETTLRSVNELLRKTVDGEQRVIGRVQKIDCKRGTVSFSIKTPTETFALTSKDFQALELNVFIEQANNVAVGCDADMSRFNAVITYKPQTPPKSVARGELLALEFVQDDFRFLTSEEMKHTPTRIVAVESVDKNGAALDPQPTDADIEKAQRDAMMVAMRSSLPQPAAGEKQEIGYLDRIECTSKGIYFHLRTATTTLRLLNANPSSLRILVATPDLSGMAFGCTLKPVEFPAVFTYADKPDAKAKTAGTITSLSFMPRSFTLN